MCVYPCDPPLGKTGEINRPAGHDPGPTGHAVTVRENPACV